MPAHHKSKPRTRHHKTTTTHSTWDGLDLRSLLSDQVKPLDVAIGAVAGLTIGGAVKYGLNRVNVSTKRADGTGGIPDPVMKYAGPISTFLGGVIAYFVRRNENRTQAQGLLAGASVTALAPIAWKLLGDFGPKMSDGTPFFSDYVMSPYGALTEDAPALGALTLDEARFNGFGDPWADPLDGGLQAP
jgi:hypothetical protein